MKTSLSSGLVQIDDMANIKKHIVFGFLFILFSTGGVYSQIRFDYGSAYTYLKGSEAADLAGNWMDVDFNDSGWATGYAPFWYGDGSGGTMISDMLGNYSTLYLRSIFEAGNIHQLSELKLSADFDDGFVLWINGEEVLRQNVPAELRADAFAPVNHESGIPEVYNIDTSIVNLVEGANTIAVQIFNLTLSSSDIHFDMSITANPALPALDPTEGSLLFSHEAGFYDVPFDLTISTTSTISWIIYTLDGSDPRTSSNTFTGDSILAINIDPASTTGRGVTPAVMVRASLQKQGFAPSIPDTRTFIFVHSVRDQTYPGAPWPSYNVNGQILDWNMDPEVVDDPRYTALIEEALLDIPSMSLVTDNNNLFDPSSGIFVNAENYGREWERDCSLELIDPDGEGFQVNAGMRIRGGASRDDGNPKHAFRIFFREEYGDPKLEFSLFGDEGTDTYDNIDLRTEQNYAWNRDGDMWGDYNTFVRDIYARTMQREMGHPYTRSRYYHLYLNGLYWGLFMTQERAEASFAESYFGDDKDDYDVIKVTTEPWPYYNIATDGNMDAWEEIWNMCQTGFSTNTSYFRLEGKDANGKPLKDSKVLVDIENLIDYMVMIFYTGSYDAPVSAWGGEEMPNNYYGIYNRKNKGTGFIFVAHDMEQCMLVDNVSVSEGLYENRVTIPEMKAANLLKFQPQWLHHKLTSNAEYRLRFADRAYKFLSEGGLFTEEIAKEKFMEFASVIDKAIIAESARWGDTKVSVPRTRDDDWLPELKEINDIFFPQRTGIVINQLLEANLYTTLIPPRVMESGITLMNSTKYFTGSLSVKIENENGKGEVQYTFDGSDPRWIGGEISQSTISSSSDVTIEIDQTTVIKARIKDGNTWSAITEIAIVNQEEDYSGLKVTELHYHPSSVIIYGDTIEGTDMEFIELKNTGDYAIDISGLVLDSAVSYTVPDKTILPPGQFYVVASKPEIFYDIHGLNPSGNYSGHFSNTGEYVLITDPLGNNIISFLYDDQYPWPLQSDGAGFSLTSVLPDPSGDPNDPAYWKNSTFAGGTPFANDDGTTSIHPVPADVEHSGFRIYPNPASEFISIQSAGTGVTDMIIYNNSGKIVYSGSFTTETTLPCNKIGSRGIYFIRLMNKDAVTTEKIIIL